MAAQLSTFTRPPAVLFSAATRSCGSTCIPSMMGRTRIGGGDVAMLGSKIGSMVRRSANTPAIATSSTRCIQTLIQLNEEASMNEKVTPQITLVGMKHSRFFGQDSSEEGLLLLERLKEHKRTVHLLIGLDPVIVTCLGNLAVVSGVVKTQQLQKLREVEELEHPQFVPVYQAALLEKYKTQAVSFTEPQLHERLARRGLSYPMEGFRAFWLEYLFRSRTHKCDDELRSSFRKNVPEMSKVYFDERAKYIASKAYAYAAEAELGENDHVVCLVEHNLFHMVLDQMSRIDSVATAKNQVEHLDEWVFPNVPFRRVATGVYATVFIIIPLSLVWEFWKAAGSQFVTDLFGFVNVDPYKRA